MTITNTTKDLLVCNLIFPSHVSELNIAGYRFVRVPDYQQRVCEMQHDISIFHEFAINECNGINRPTAIVHLPSIEKPAVFKWADANATALIDVLLLLTLFLKRQIFCPELQLDEDGKQIIKRKSGDDTDFDPAVALLEDPRESACGGILKCSFSKDLVKTTTGYANIGIERGLQEVYAVINKVDWQETYDHGWFLFLARMAFRQQPLESRFIHCWTIWEHLYSVLHRHQLRKSQIRNVSSAEKISFLLTRYALKDVSDNASLRKIRELSQMRNHLVHYGGFSDQHNKENALLVVRLTEFLIAKALGLSPSNIFNTIDTLEDFLSAANTASKPS